MGTAHVIREKRKAAGLGERELAEHLGISVAAYGDLERYDDELATVVSYGEARALATSLATPLVELLGLKPSHLPRVSIHKAAALLRERVEQPSCLLDRVEDEVGWYLAKFFEDPMAYAAENPVEFLDDIAKYLQIDLYALVEGHDA